MVKTTSVNGHARWTHQDAPTGYIRKLDLLRHSIDVARRAGRPLEEVTLEFSQVLRRHLPKELAILAYEAMQSLNAGLRLPKSSIRLVSEDESNDGAAASKLDVDAKEFVKARVGDLLFGLPYEFVGEGIGREDRTTTPPGRLWVVIDPLDGSTTAERTGEGFAVVVMVFMQGPNGPERIAIGIATSPAGGSSAAITHGGHVHLTWDGQEFDEIGNITRGEAASVAMVTGGKPKVMRYLCSLVERLDADASAAQVVGGRDRPWTGDVQAGNPALVKLLLLELGVLVQAAPHKIYDAAFLYGLVRHPDIDVLHISDGRRMTERDLDAAVAKWIAKGCPNNLRTVEPYIVSTIPGAAELVRELVVELGPIQD